MKTLQLFISYASKDRAVVGKIHNYLEEAGFEVWRDQTRLVTDWSREIAFALADCDVVCLMWSQHAAASKWVKHEWLTARALEKPIIVCLLPDAPELPKPLINLHGVIFEELQKGCKHLIERLKNIDLEPVRYDYTILPENSDIPFNPNPHFTGRHTDLLELYMKMIGNLSHIGINQIGAVGMGGIGKTQLAVEFAYRFGFAYHGIYWIQSRQAGWLTQFVELARDRLQLRIPNPDSAEANKQYIFALQKYCKTHPNTLIIMDNVAEPKLLNNDACFFGLTPLTLGCDLLFTTRKHFQIPGVILQAVDILSPESAVALLTAERQPESLTEREKAKAICSAVGNLPLALTLAASYLRAYPEVSFADYYDELRRNKFETVDLARLSPEELATRHEAAVATTLQSQWDMLKDENARHLFHLAGLFPEAEIIPKARLALLSGIEQEKTSLHRPLDKAFHLLHELSLIEKLDSKTVTLRLHPLVRDFSQRMLSELEQITYKAKAAKALNDAYFDYLRLESELQERGVNQIIDDMQVALEWSGDEQAQFRDLELLRSALRLSANELSHDRQQLPSQLHGRLLGNESNKIQIFLERSIDKAKGLWLRPLAPTLTRAGGPLLRTLNGHHSEVTAVAITPNAKLAVSGLEDKTLKVWNLQTGECCQTLEGHHGRITSVAITAHGQLAVSGSRDHTLKIWNLQTGECLDTLEGHRNSVTAVATTPDGKLAVSCSYDDTVKVWNLQSGECSHTLKGRSSGVTSVGITPDGQLSVYASCGSWNHTRYASLNDTLKAWRLQMEVSLHMLDDHSSDVVATTLDDQIAMYVVNVACDDWAVGHLYIQNLETGERREALESHDDGVITAVAITPDGKLGVSGSEDRTLKVWNVQTGECCQTLKGHDNEVTSVAISADGQLAVSGSKDKTLKVWSLRTVECRHTPEIHRSGVNSVAITPDGQIAVSVSDGDFLHVWDVQRGECRHRLKSLDSHGATSVAVSSDGQRVVSNSGSDFKVFDLQTGKCLDNLERHMGICTAVAITLDGQLAVSAYKNTLKVWNLQTRACSRTLEGHGERFEAVAITADGQLAVSSSWDNIKVWNLQTGECIRTLKGHGDWLNAVAITADGQLAVSSSWENIIVWDLQTGECLRILKGHNQSPCSVTITPDGRFAVSVSWDKTIKVWNFATGKSIADFIGESRMWCCAVSADGTTIVTGDTSGRVHFLRLEGLEA